MTERDEVTLETLLGDPITQMMMERDGITEAVVRRLMRDVGERLPAERLDASWATLPKPKL